MAKRIKKSIFYQKIALLCDEAGISVAKMAENMRVSDATPTQWGKGSHPKTPTIRRIAAYFGVSFDYLDDDDIAVGAESAQIKSNNHIDVRSTCMGDVKTGQKIYRNLNMEVDGKNRFYKNVTKLCDDKGFNIFDMLNYVGISKRDLKHWENGRRIPARNNIVEIGYYLGVTRDELMNGVDTCVDTSMLKCSPFFLRVAKLCDFKKKFISEFLENMDIGYESAEKLRKGTSPNRELIRKAADYFRADIELLTSDNYTITTALGGTINIGGVNVSIKKLKADMCNIHDETKFRLAFGVSRYEIMEELSELEENCSDNAKNSKREWLADKDKINEIMRKDAIITYLSFEIARRSMRDSALVTIMEAGGDESTIETWKHGAMPSYSVMAGLASLFGGTTPERLMHGDFWKEALDKLKEREVYDENMLDKDRELAEAQKQIIAAQKDTIDSLKSQNEALEKKLRRAKNSYSALANK